MKNFLTLLLLAVSLMSSYAYDVEIDGIYYDLVPKGHVAIVTQGDIKYEGNITIPETLEYDEIEYTVKSISDNAFQKCTSLESVIIPNTVNNFGEWVFDGCCNLVSVKLPINIEKLSWCLFHGCIKLKNIDIPSSVTYIAGYAFSETGIENIEIPNSVTTIEQTVFMNCEELRTVTIPNSVKELGYSVFKGCTNIERIVLPNSLSKINNYMFEGCTRLKYVFIPNTIENIGEGAFNGCASLQSIIIPNSVRIVNHGAFKGCTSLLSVKIPNSIVTIGNKAFEGCQLLSSITIENGDLNIWEMAFANCPSIENIFCYAQLPPSIEPNSFYESYIEYANLYVPAESIDAYKAADVWKDFGNIRSLSDVTFAETINVSADKNVLGVGETETLTANVLPANATNKSVTWSSSNSNIVGVNAETGEITAVAYGSAVITATAMDGSNVTGSITITVKAETYILADGEEYLNNQEFPCDELTYTRTFTNTAWQSMYIPFSIPVSVLEEKGLEVAEIYNVHQYDRDEDGVYEETNIDFLKMKSGATLANYPYMVRAKEAGDVTVVLNDIEVAGAESVTIDCSTVKQLFTFTGTYDGVSGSVIYNNNYYAMNGNGGLQRAANSSVSLKPQRWYLAITNRDGSPVDYYAPNVRITVDGIEEEGFETSIEGINAQPEAESVYTLSGQIVNGEALAPGIYVKEGKKIIVK